MGRIRAFLCVTFSVVTLIPFCSSSSDILPAFLWSSDDFGSLHSGLKEIVNYNTVLPKELAQFVLSEGGWASHVCSREKPQHGIDVALVFLGRKLRSSDLSRKASVDPSLIDALQSFFTSSNFSMAFPYVVKTDNNEKLENSLISGFSETCGNGLPRKHIAISEACSMDDDDFTKLADLNSVQEYIKSSPDSKLEGKANLVVYCNDNTGDSEHLQSEAEVLAKLISVMEKSGVRYSVLYASDPLERSAYAQRIPYRALAEDSGNKSVRSAGCDGVCQIKSSLLEGIFVAIVLLIILLSGLCCMMGIDTPSRFESPQES